MLRTILRHPMLAAAAEVLLDAVRYVAIMLVLMMLLGEIARFLSGTP